MIPDSWWFLIPDDDDDDDDDDMMMMIMMMMMMMMMITGRICRGFTTESFTSEKSVVYISLFA